MGCSGCSDGGSPNGCGNNGACSSGGCNRMNTYDWLAKMDIYDPMEYDIVEVSFKNGARKAYFKNLPHTRAITGDMVVVDAGNGYDLGRMTLSGDLVRLQLKKRKIREDEIFPPILRIANGRDLERLGEARDIEKASLVRARVISRTLGLNMKLGDVEYRADKRKATFFYTAENRVDFRELVRSYAKEFKVKIEMRQIGARQESARIGGIGSCGRELCCSTWLTDFRSVSTAAARYQNLAINQAKLSGQCGRLKCCLNYELDTYMDALEAFPKNVDKLFTEAGKAVLVKTDIFKRTMYFAYLTEHGARGKFYPLTLERVKEIVAMNKNGEKPAELLDDSAKYGFMTEAAAPSVEFGDDEGLTGVIELPPEERRRRKKNRKKKRSPQNKSGKPNQNQRNNSKGRGENKSTPQKKQGQKGQTSKEGNQKGQNQKGKNPRNQRRNQPAKGQGKNNPNQDQQNKNNDGKNKPNPSRNNRNKNRRNQQRKNNKPNPNKSDNNNDKKE